MKSSAAQLEHRGYCTTEILQEHRSKDNDELCRLLRDGQAPVRTAGATLLGERRAAMALSALCEALTIEKRLYTKIALCEALAKFEAEALPHILPLIGRITGTQHKTIGLVDIGKKTFPLPRDIACRIIIRTGPAALPPLEAMIEHGLYEQMLEAIDAIGHIAFTSFEYRSEPVLVRKYFASADELTRWKLIRAFQSFVSGDVEGILEKIIATNGNTILIAEAERSLDRLKTRRARRRALEK